MATPLGYQITIDSRDPHAQARFWALALHYEVEDNDAFVRSLLDQGHVTSDDVVDVEGRLHFAIGAAIHHPDDARGSSGEPPQRRLLFMRVPEDKTVKNRMHLDLNVGHDRIDAEVARLTRLGARELYRVDEPGAWHTTMADPEGNEFCVQ